MLRSAVSSRMIDRICTVEGVRLEETLTGFKWLGNRALDLEKEGYQVLLAYEEAIGFCSSSPVFFSALLHLLRLLLLLRIYAQQPSNR